MATLSQALCRLDAEGIPYVLGRRPGMLVVTVPCGPYCWLLLASERSAPVEVR